MAASFVRFESSEKSGVGSEHVSRQDSNPPRKPSPAELEAIELGDLSGYVGPARPAPVLTGHRDSAGSTDAYSYAKSPGEMRPPSLDAAETTPAIQTWNSPSINKWRIFGASLVYLSNGMNDSAPGALLPYIEEYYNVNYAVVSTIFISNAVGFILAAFFVHALDSKIGRAKTMMFCEACVIVGYIIMGIPSPFAGFVVGFFISGYGMATSLALNNVFAANTEPSSTVLGIVHGCYGIGGLIAPIIATAAVTHGLLFSRIYLIIMALRVCNFFLTGWTFWNFERDNPPINKPLLPAQQQGEGAGEASLAADKKRSLVKALKAKTTLLGAAYIFAYQGAEVSISGWVISFLINYRQGDPAQVGYVTAGFWGGITIGRFCLTPFALRVGEVLFSSGLIGLTIVFQLLLWLVPNVIANSVATAIVGLLLGPIYPCATRVFSKLLERRLQPSALAFISSAGSSGGAVAPFLTGVIAQQRGTWVLSPICIGLYTLMLGCWTSLTWGYDRKRRV